MQAPPLPIANGALRAATSLWLAVTVVGQWLFFWYLAAFYVRAIVSGHAEQWNRNENLFKGYAPGDTAWNVQFGAHVVMAAVIALGGSLQLVPRVRARALAFHRWNGRAFMVTALGGAVTGLWMTLVRRVGLSGGSIGSVAVSVDALLIVAFAVQAWREARAGRIDAHRRWALRLFMAANGVWFLRLGLYGWYVLTGGVGLTDALDGPANVVFDFGSYLLPLAVLELHQRASRGDSARSKVTAASVLALATVYMAVGVFALTTAHRRFM
jgi:hypothetical protein